MMINAMKAPTTAPAVPPATAAVSPWEVEGDGDGVADEDETAATGVVD